MNVKERRRRILELVQANRIVANEDLQRQFDVTKETIRKDLNDLSDKGYILRTLGGAIARDEYDPSIAQRTISNLPEKRRIAAEALKLIKPNDVIALDSGSTTLELANLFSGDDELVILTNSLNVLNTVSKHSAITAIGTGGVLRMRSLSFQGAITEKTVQAYNISKTFISAKALDPDRGVMDSNESEAAVKRLMIENAQHTTLLVDHTKFSRTAHVTVCPAGRIDRIITSTMADNEVLDRLRKSGIEIITVQYQEKTP